MKIGTQMNELAERIIHQAQAKKDYAMDTRNLSVTDAATLRFTVKGAGIELAPTRLCLQQIGNRVGIPSKYMERMQTEAPQLLAQNVNHWFKNAPEKRMVRTLQNGSNIARAFLSDSYRPLDNFDLVNAVLPHVLDAGCDVKSAELTETRLYIQAVTPHIKADIKSANVGDTLYAGVTISNSEVGCGALRVEPLIYKLGCKNGMIMSTALWKGHVGRAGDGAWDGNDAYEMFSNATRQLDDKAFWAKVNDVVRASFDAIKFKENVARLEATTKIDVGEPQEAVEVVSDRFKLLEGESKSILNHLARGGDMSLWGLANAITRTAEDVESYDRAIELERFGGMAVELPASAFRN